MDLHAQGPAPWCAAMKFLHLNFLPRSSDAALLTLRLWHGTSMLMLHGWGKLMNYSALSDTFGDPLGVGKTTSLLLVIFGEVICSVLLILGLYTRAAALGSALTMATAFWFAHGGKLKGAGNGELAFIFLGVFAALFIAGAGRFSLDAKLGAKR